jgi:hypothetical protein
MQAYSTIRFSGRSDLTLGQWTGTFNKNRMEEQFSTLPAEKSMHYSNRRDEFIQIGP